MTTKQDFCGGHCRGKMGGMTARACGLALLLLSAGGLAQDRDPESAATCGQCHKDQFREWQGHGHATAWTNPVYQQALKGKSKPESCHACHIPAAVLERLGHRPQARARLRDEGVNCVACHRVGETMHGPFECKTDAHATEKNPAFVGGGSSSLCASCHATKIGPVLPVAKDFAESGLAEKGKTCAGCHMPEVERPLAFSLATGKPVGEPRKSREHRILGPDDPEFVAKAFALTVQATAAEIRVTVRNEAGHRVPGLTLRKFVVRLRQLTADGKEARREKDHEIGSDLPLAAGESREIRLPRAPGATELDLAIDHVFADKTVATVVKRGTKL